MRIETGLVPGRLGSVTIDNSKLKSLGDDHMVGSSAGYRSSRRAVAMLLTVIAART